MLLELSINNVVLIDRLRLELEHGLTAMTGETGAGKSIVLDALGLALGERAERSLVRADTDKAQVTARFDLDADHPVRGLLADREIELDADEDLVLRRTVSADGKSRAYINDTPVSAVAVRDLAGQLVEVHGQHDGRGLMDVQSHQKLLDDFAGHEKSLAACANAWEQLVQARKHLSELQTQAASDGEELEWLQAAAAELDRLDPKTGEEATLAATRSLLMQSEKLIGHVEASREALSQEPSPEDQLGTALRHLEQAQNRLDMDAEQSIAGQKLAETRQAMEQALLGLQDAEAGLQDIARHLQLDPQELETAEERLFSLRALARKHECQVDELGQIRQQLSNRLDAVQNLDQALDLARQAAGKAVANYESRAQKLSGSRKRAAKKLDKAILQELSPLRMEKARFSTCISLLELAQSGPAGRDRVRFEIAANPGMPFGPLQSVASGGELSRVSLAIKAALAAGSGPGTMIFDEIDQGVGGAVADAVGRRLSDLSSQTQVLVITHSPQVAARANTHHRIEKAEIKGASLTSLHWLDKPEREEEIARMLSGANITDEAIEAAKSLLYGNREVD